MRRQEKASAPVEEQEPHRLAVSLTVTEACVAPSAAQWRSTAALRSCSACLRRKSVRRRGRCGISPQTPSVGGSPRLDLHRASALRDMHDAMRNAAQRDHGALGEPDVVCQPAEPGCDPGRMLLGEGPRRREAAAQWHRQDNVALGRADPQGVAARGLDPAHGDGDDGGAHADLEAGRDPAARCGGKVEACDSTRMISERSRRTITAASEAPCWMMTRRRGGTRAFMRGAGPISSVATG